MREKLSHILEEIDRRGNYRTLRYLTPISATKVRYEGRDFINLCSNSYLSLQDHPRLLEAVRNVLEVYGSGSCSSRSVSGNIDLYRALEEKIAIYKGYPRALIFSTGYMANIGIISTLTDRGDVIFSDELNHSSLIHSMRLSRARKVVYRHRDPEDLERKLARESCEGQRFIVTESVFSMDGDVAPLAEIYTLKERYGANVILDDAHGTGVFGVRGTGAEEMFGLAGKMDIHMATFGKSLASFGAFVLADPVIIEFLVNRAKTFMYTTALPATALAASMAALELVESDLSFRDGLWRNIDYIRSGLEASGFDLKESHGPIIPIVVGEDTKALEMQKMLMAGGLYLQAIRPPTVPTGTSRLRLTVIRAFSKEEMDYSIGRIAEAGRVMGLIEE
jgi:8-amino-7-oxononanoate synthase